MGTPLSEAELTQIKNSFRRCSAETIDAIIQFRQAKDSTLIPQIVIGIIERYAPAESAKKISTMNENTRLIEDLGIDSLTMLEVVLSIEEALSIRIENEELMQIRTLGEVKTFISQKTSGEASSSGTSSAGKSKRFTREEIIMTLPQQPPFLFLDSAEIDGDTIHAHYAIKGDEYFLEGHFKDNPVFPASIVFEGMGQAACLWILSKAEEKLGKPLDAKNVLFGSMESAHFFRKARPGETLDFEVSLSKLREPLSIFTCKASVNGEKVSTIEELVIIFGEATEGVLPKPEAEEIQCGYQGDPAPQKKSRPKAKAAAI